MRTIQLMPELHNVLSPQLVGLEGRLVEVEDMAGNVRQFLVGLSAAECPTHLELPPHPKACVGEKAKLVYRNVKVLPCNS